MKILNKNLSLKLDIVVTLINGIIVIGGIFILNGLVARLHGLEVLGEFLLVKRTISSSMGILLIGLNIALPNYLSRNFDKSFADNSSADSPSKKALADATFPYCEIEKS